ncbi:MAG: helix-turn-helix domain-containing protein [Acidobacteria bacterium]|nr:helix-turn-helix domain-containing protein [Acidobacteriota bacterium]
MTDALECLSALAHETRLAAFRHLVQIGPAGLPVGSLQEKLGVPPATLTAHLQHPARRGPRRGRT